MTLTAPVPRWTGGPTMIFSATPVKTSTSPERPASSRWGEVISNAARARTEVFAPEIPCRLLAAEMPSVGA